MATYNGREARVTVNASTTEALVTELSSWNITMSADEIDTTAFGDGWAKSDVGMKKWSGTISGYCDPEDTTGQDVLETAYKNGTLLGDIRFYLQYSEITSDTIIYYAPDTATDANAGLRVTSFEVSQDKSGVGMLNVSFSGSGPILQTTATVP